MWHRPRNYTMVKDDTLATAMIKVWQPPSIRGDGDPTVFAEFEPVLGVIKLVARKPGTDGNNITLAVSGSTNATFIDLRPAGPRFRAGKTLPSSRPERW